jgi:hypothetical protein
METRNAEYGFSDGVATVARLQRFPNLQVPHPVSTPITVVARSEASTAFVRSNTGIMGSNPTRGMDDCVRLFYV